MQDVADLFLLSPLLLLLSLPPSLLLFGSWIHLLFLPLLATGAPLLAATRYPYTVIIVVVVVIAVVASFLNGEPAALSSELAHVLHTLGTQARV
jgi:hypothetical protein